MNWLKFLSGLVAVGVLALLIASVTNLALTLLGNVPALVVTALVVLVVLALAGYGGADDISTDRTTYW